MVAVEESRRLVQAILTSTLFPFCCALLNFCVVGVLIFFFSFLLRFFFFLPFCFAFCRFVFIVLYCYSYYF